MDVLWLVQMIASIVGQTCDSAVKDDPILWMVLGKGDNQRFNKDWVKVWNNAVRRSISLYIILSISKKRSILAK